MDISTGLLHINSLEQLTRENIIDEYLNLQSQYKNQLTENENLQQENYKYRSSITVLENTKADIENENDQLQTENKNLRKEIKKFQEQILNLAKQNEILLHDNETCEQHEEFIRELQIELEKNKNTINTLNETNNDLIKENEKLNDDFLRFQNVPDNTEDIQEMKLIIEQYVLELNELRCRNNDLNSEFNEIKNILEYKNQQLIDVNQLRESLQEELASHRNELDLIKTTIANNPANKGNSLFGEVYDSRQQLQKKLNLLKKHCLDLKNKYALQLAENKKLSNENVILSKQWKDEINSRFDIEYAWKEAHEQTIESLKENIKFLKDEINKLNKFSIPKIPLTEKWMLDNVKDLYERNQKLVIETEEKLNKRIFCDFLASERLNFVEREVYKWKSLATTYEIAKNNLELELFQLKTQADSTLNDPQDLVEFLNDDENKENSSLFSNSMLNKTFEPNSSLDLSNKSDVIIKQENLDTKPETSPEVQVVTSIEQENLNIKLETSPEVKVITSIKQENLNIKLETSPEVKVITSIKHEKSSSSNDKNVYRTPPPGRIFVPKKKLIVKSIKTENTK